MNWKNYLFFLLTTVFFACDSNPLEEEVDCSVTDLELKVTKVKIADCGLQNGEITVEATGGTPPYQYNIEGNPPQESGVFKNIGPTRDPYNLFVTDKNGCQESASTIMSQKGPFSATATVSPAGCEESNGKITAEPFNGTPPYKYQLGENGQYQDENYWENLPAGIYSVWIADANDCYKGITEIQVPTGVSFSETIAPILNTNCTLDNCHGGAHPPDFREFSNIQANAEKIKTTTQDKSMPVERTLTEEEIRLITCWVEDGAPDN